MESRRDGTVAAPPPEESARMAANPDRSLGFLSALYSRLRAAASAWRRHLGQEATVVRRPGAPPPRRFGRNLAFVSFNLELLLFVYAFWRARRRNFNWRQPLQLLPMLVIPALATLIYAAFVRFTRTLDPKDKKTLQHQNDSLQKGSASHHNSQNSAKKCDPMDDATNFSSDTDPAETCKLGKHHSSSVNLRDDGGRDVSWGHSKPIRSCNTHITNSSAFRQLINWSSEHLSDDPEDRNHLKGTTTEHHSNSGADGAACSTSQRSSLLPGCSIVHIVSNATVHADFSSSTICPKSNGCPAEEDAVQTAPTAPKSDLELRHEGVENESSKFNVEEDNWMPFISEKELLVSSYAEKNIEPNSGTSGFTLCSEETEKENVTGGFCFVKISPELSFLSPSELVVEGGKDTSEKKSLELDKKDGNNVAVNSEEVLLSMSVVNTAEPDYGTEGFSLHPQYSIMMEVPAVTNIFSVTPESSHLASLELPAENYGDSNDAQTCDVHLPEQKGQEDFLDPLVVDSFEDSFATSEFLSRSAGAEMTEVLGAVKEGLSEGASNHQNDVVAPSSDGGDAENVMSYSVSVELIPEPNILEALQNGQETSSDPMHHSSFRSGIFLSSNEISNDEAYSSNSNSYTLYANSMENEELLASKGGGSVSKDEMDFAFLDTSILLDEVKSGESWTDSAECSRCIPESNRTQSLHDDKQALPRTSERANFGLEESLISLDQEINLEIFSLYSRSSSCVSEVNMTEILRGGTFPAQENLNDFSFDERTSMMVPNVKHAENYTDNARTSELIPEINMIETPNVGKEATAPLEHEVSSNCDISFKAPDVGNGVEKFDNSLDLLSWSFGPLVDASESLQAAQGFSKLQSENDFAFGFQGPEKAMVSISQYEVDSLEKNVSDSICADEATMNGDIQGISKSPSQSQVELPGAYVTTDKVNHPEHSRSSSSVPDYNLIEVELAAGKERSFDPKDENPSNFQETSPSESLSYNLMCASHTSKKDSVTFSVKGFPDPSLEDVDSFDKISGDEQVNKSHKENALGCEQIVRTRAEDNSIESRDFTETSNCNCTQASESVNEGFFEQENQGPELVCSQVGMTFFIDEGEETEKYLGSSSTACALETLQELPVSAGNEEGFLEASKVREWCCTDKEPKDTKVNDMEEDVQDLDKDHENSP